MFIVNPVFNANSEASDQPFDPGLHCLPVTLGGVGGGGWVWVQIKMSKFRSLHRYCDVFIDILSELTETRQILYFSCTLN